MLKMILVACVLLIGSITAAAKERNSVSEEEVFALQASAEAGDRIAIRKLFELFPHSGGAVTEDIDVVLGRTIHNHPQLFLEELIRSGRANCDLCLPSLVGNAGDELVDRLSDQVKELAIRQKALKSVHKRRVSR